MPARFVNEARGTILRLSQLTTQALGRPSSSPRATSLAMRRTVGKVVSRKKDSLIPYFVVAAESRSRVHRT